MLSIQIFEFNSLAENTYVLFDSAGEGVVIDPGCSTPEECAVLSNFITKKKIKINYLLNTHCHVDHVLGNYFVKNTYRVPFLIHANEDGVLRAVKIYAGNYGFFGYTEVLPDSFLAEGDTVQFGTTVLSTLFLPGHSPGHVGFYHAESKSLFAGDVLFERSIGRTDLPGGHFETLINSIQQKIFLLPNDVTVYPGHGGPTTVGQEKIHNPYCAVPHHA
jgi:glyoxylase-like metal-dependent hydrolase (beta-lactamase superfamily II)